MSIGVEARRTDAIADRILALDGPLLGLGGPFGPNLAAHHGLARGILDPKLHSVPHVTLPLKRHFLRARDLGLPALDPDLARDRVAGEHEAVALRENTDVAELAALLHAEDVGLHRVVGE